jgi:hypothetical protein
MPHIPGHRPPATRARRHRVVASVQSHRVMKRAHTSATLKRCRNNVAHPCRLAVPPRTSCSRPVRSGPQSHDPPATPATMSRNPGLVNEAGGYLNQVLNMNPDR